MRSDSGIGERGGSWRDLAGFGVVVKGFRIRGVGVVGVSGSRSGSGRRAWRRSIAGALLWVVVRWLS